MKLVLGVLITRPQPACDQLIEQIEQRFPEQWRPFPFPLIEIESLPIADFQSQLEQLSTYDRVIFTSIPAVEGFWQALCSESLVWPEGLKVAAVGRGTDQRLQALGISVHDVPTQYDSEHLLALPAFQQLQGQRCLLVKGEGGRLLLYQTLSDRGAKVECCEVYHRVCPSSTKKLSLWLGQLAFNTVLITSATSWTHLNSMLNPTQYSQLSSMTFIVISQRLRQLIVDAFPDANVIVTSQASDDSILLALQEAYAYVHSK